MTPALPLTEHSTLMVLSPHLDDAVLSCGALIADSRRRGTDVIVVTVFNGRPTMPVSAPAARFHARCGLTDSNAMDEREREDDRAIGAVGASTERLYLPEALYRKDSGSEPLYDTDLAIFHEGPLTPDDCLITVANRVGAQVDAAAPDLVLAPLGIGGHVDHLVVSQAARRLDRGVPHYEDVPYLLYDRCKGWRDKIRTAAPARTSPPLMGGPPKLAASSATSRSATSLVQPGHLARGSGLVRLHHRLGKTRGTVLGAR